MNKMAFREINFNSIIIGTLLSADCGGNMRFSATEEVFQLNFRSEDNCVIEFIVEVENIKKIFKSVINNGLILDFKLKPAAIRNIGDFIKKTNESYIYQISRNMDESKFQIFLNDINHDDILFIDKFFASIDIFDENVSKVIKETEPQQQPVKKHRKKKLPEPDPEDGSQDYVPQKRPRKQSFSKLNSECEVVEQVPKRSLRVRNRDDVNLCEDMTEEAQFQEALKRSLKGVDQQVIESIRHIEDASTDQDMTPVEIYDNIDKTIELFTYNTSNGDIIVRMEDYLCLSRNEYLSDVIIDFYLHYIYNVKMTPEQREKTLIIGTHFYTLYATSSEYSGWNDGLNAGLNAKEKRYRRIDGILKQDVNIFEKDFIIMPLMDHNHWFLAIVCFPKLNGSFTFDGNVKVDENDAKRNPKKNYQVPIRSSCILIFDSVKGNGSRRTVAINHIKNFLEYEWINKYQNEFFFDVKCLNGHSPKVPLQMNNVDCGCFILEFMERFFVTSPFEDFRFPIDLGDWFSSEEVRNTKRREIAEVIKSLMESSNNHVELPNIRFHGDRKRKSSKSVSSADQDIPMEDNNGNAYDTFQDHSENGNNGNCSAIENDNNNNGNNNDEAFNNNNDFNCLDSNNSVQNVNMIVENHESEDLMTENDNTGNCRHDEMELIPTFEANGFKSEANGNLDAEDSVSDAKAYMFEDDANECLIVDSDAETIKNHEYFENDAEIYENGAEINGNDAEIDVNDSIKIESEAKVDESNGKDAEVDESNENDAKINESNENDANIFKSNSMEAENETKAVEKDAKLSDNEAEAQSFENDVKAVINDANVNSSILRVESNDSVVENIDLTLDNSDDEEQNIKSSDIKEDVHPQEAEQSNNQDQQEENQKSENMQSFADRISQSISIKESTSVLLE